jgi:hypothetical protein
MGNYLPDGSYVSRLYLYLYHNNGITKYNLEATLSDGSTVN